MHPAVVVIVLVVVVVCGELAGAVGRFVIVLVVVRGTGRDCW